MKEKQIAVAFSNPVKNLRTTLVNDGARKIMLQPTYDGWLSVQYEVPITDPRLAIEQLIENTGAQVVGFKNNEHGASFDFRVDDCCDEKQVYQQVVDAIQRAGYRVERL